MTEEDTEERAAAKYAAQRANERITDHIASCAQQYERIDRAFKRNDSSHERLQKTLDERLVSKDRYTAVERIVWGLAGAVGLGVVAAVLSLVLK